MYDLYTGLWPPQEFLNWLSNRLCYTTVHFTLSDDQSNRTPSTCSNVHVLLFAHPFKEVFKYYALELAPGNLCFIYSHIYQGLVLGKDVTDIYWYSQLWSYHISFKSER